MKLYRDALWKIVLGLIWSPVLSAQMKDSIPRISINSESFGNATSKFPVKALLVPGLMITYGVSALHNNSLLGINEEVKEEVWIEHSHGTTTVDDYLQWSPAVAVYAFNALGMKGSHNLFDRSMLFVLSNAIMNTAVISLKHTAHELRPDKSAFTSFPSGHTAEAFLSAEFLREEYKSVSPWYGVGGYVAAFATGYLRLYNNKHWVNDIVAGAGIGILSTRLAYWLYPKMKLLFDKRNSSSTFVTPYYQNKGAGISLVYHFHQ